MMLLLVAGAAALVPPGSRPSGAVACRGAAYDYCVQSLGCTAKEATKAEGALLPNIAESMTRAQAEERLGWLQSELGLSDAELKKVVMRFPALLGYSVEDNMAPKLDWLQARLDLDDAGLRKMVLRLPALLSCSVENNLTPKLDWLQTRLDLDDAGLRKMVLLLPALLSYSIEDNMEPKLQWLQTRLDLDGEQLRKMVLTFPALLNYSVEGNMEPKLGFFQEELGLSVSEVRASIVSAPARLSLSLKKRYRARLEVCRAAGADPVVVLNRAIDTDEKFCKRVGVPLEALRAAQETDVTVGVAPCKMVALSPAPRVASRVLDDVASAAAVLSYKHHEPHLLETAYADLACRGRLEQHLADRATTLPLVPRFLTILALAAGHSAEGAAIARALAADAGPSRPPRRSLVGCVEGYDVALLRDKLDGHERFSLILGNDRKKGAKAARILCEVDEVAIHVRGVEVAEEQRGRGLAKLALGTLAALGVLVDADVRARPQTKPVVARALTSLGFRPVDASWPILIAPGAGGRTVVCPADPADERIHFSFAQIRAQRLDVVAAPPSGAKPTFVRTAFVHPDSAALAATVPAEFYAARLLAFAGTVDALRPRLLAQSSLL